MTHNQAVRHISHWLQSTKQNTIVLTELTTYAEETPDCLAFSPGKQMSTLVECKVSRADFLKDKQKSFRAHEQQGVGDYRFFAAPEGLLKEEEIPEGWGFVEICKNERHGVCVRVRRDAEKKTPNHRNETYILCSALRRLEISSCVFIARDV